MTGYIIAGAALLLALAVVACDRWRTVRTMRRLDEMLTAAINGTFSEKAFDESRLSALESRLARYLAASALSVTVKRLRGKLEKDPANPEYIKTVYGIGYTWAVKP